MDAIRNTMREILATLPERWRWTIHNVFGHPVSEMLWQLGARSAADWVHDSTIPEHAKGEGRG